MRRVQRAIAALAIGTSALVLGAPPSQGMTHQVSFQLVGDGFDFGGLDYPVAEPSTFTGTWNDATGELSGALTFAPSNVDLGGEFIVPVLTSAIAPATGKLDKATGAMRLGTTLEIELDDSDDATSCVISPVPIVFRTAGAGTPFDFLEGTVGVAATDTAVPAAQDCGEETALVNVVFGLPTTSGAALLELEQEAAPPGRPRGVIAEARNEAARVSWKPPRNSGGALIFQYQVVSAPQGKTCVTNGTLSCVVRNLKNGTKYTFTVRAFNVGGASPFSAPSDPVKPQA